MHDVEMTVHLYVRFPQKHRTELENKIFMIVSKKWNIKPRELKYSNSAEALSPNSIVQFLCHSAQPNKQK